MLLGTRACISYAISVLKNLLVHDSSEEDLKKAMKFLEYSLVRTEKLEKVIIEDKNKLLVVPNVIYDPVNDEFIVKISLEIEATGRILPEAVSKIVKELIEINHQNVNNIANAKVLFSNTRRRIRNGSAV